MAIQREHYLDRGDGVGLCRTYSDAGMRIRQEGTGILYDEAIDIEDSAPAYEETDEPITTADGVGDGAGDGGVDRPGMDG